MGIHLLSRPAQRRFLTTGTWTILSIAMVSACSSQPDDSRPGDSADTGTSHASQPAPEYLKAQVEERLDYNDSYFTQGLEVGSDGSLLVGTGLYEQSKLIKLDKPGGTVTSSQDLPDELFGEGITQAGSSIWQLSWKAGTALRYNAQTLELEGQASYPGQGWGLCALDDELIMSDGSASLRHLDPQTFQEISRIQVTLNGAPVDRLNELECVDGQVLANIWYSTDIVRIDPQSGQVTAVIDASPDTGVKSTGPLNPDAVLNGIAHIPGTQEYYLTGKLWPDIYRVRFVPAKPVG